MNRWQSMALLGGLILLSTGCALPWPSDLPAHTYSGVVLDGPRRAPAAGAEIRAMRPTFVFRGVFPLLAPDTSEIGRATADARGHFTLRTTTGSATSLAASTSDEHLTGVQMLRSDNDPGGLRITVDHAAVGSVVFGPMVDAGEPLFAVTMTAVERIIRDIAAHPREPAHSLGEYARRGTISPEALTAFKDNSGLFFGPSPRVKYGWGKDVLVFPGADQPISLRHRKPGGDDPW